MIISIEEAKDALRLDGDDNDEIIQSLLEAIPSYLEAKTGRDWSKDNTVHPLAQTVTKFILQLWYDPQEEDTAQFKRTIDNLLGTLTVVGRQQQ